MTYVADDDILADLIANFIKGLQLAKLTPKRFLLQTGAKHYGFVCFFRDMILPYAN